MRTFFKFFVGTVTVFAAFMFGAILYSAFTVSAQEPEQITVGVKTVTVPKSAQPAHLKIPVLAIDAPIQNVGIARSGAIGIPTNFSDVGWYKYGPAPGAVGNAIIDGHRDNAVALPGVFKNLNDLKKGDDIYVTASSGKTFHFKVTKKELLDYDSTNTIEIFGPATTANLILITCEGTWDQSAKEYSQRLIVFTTLAK